MARSDEAAAWTAAVYNAVREVPHGKVTNYGHIARLLGKRCYLDCIHVDSATLTLTRQVGVSLKHLPSATDQPDAHYNNDNVPWQRIVNAKGTISPRGANGAARQATALRAEGVEVLRGSLGEYTVDLATYGWFPDILPSDLAEDETSDSDIDSDKD